MTSAATIKPGRVSGFTLIEMVIVLAILALFIGGAATYSFVNSTERSFKETAGEIEILAKRARTMALLNQIPYAIEFRPGSVRLLPFAEAGVIETKTALGQTVGGEKIHEDSTRGGTRTSISVPDNLQVFIRRWNTDEWLPMGDRFVHVWRFDADGLCEPISVRLTVGSSYYQDIYHPLTASVCDTEFEIK